MTTMTKTTRRKVVEIKFEELPATLKDAIVITESIIIKHLWVDALCIFQDDNNDKAFEVTQKGSVYTQTTVVITI